MCLPTESGMREFIDETDTRHGHKGQCKTDNDATCYEHSRSSRKCSEDSSWYLRWWWWISQSRREFEFLGALTTIKLPIEIVRFRPRKSFDHGIAGASLENLMMSWVEAERLFDQLTSLSARTGWHILYPVFRRRDYGNIHWTAAGVEGNWARPYYIPRWSFNNMKKKSQLKCQVQKQR